MATRRRAAAPVVEEIEDDDAFEELEDDGTDDDGLEELEDEAPPAKPAKKTAAKKTAAKATAAPKAEVVEASPYNSAWLAEYVTETTGVDVDSRGLRMLLRKMAANDELARIVGEDRGRYTFPKGPNDATVKLVIRKVKAGELTVAKREKVEAVKATAAKKAPAKKAAPVEDDEAPVETTRVRSRRRGEAPATPAKATPAKRTRRAAAAAE